jgi:hypothetical protein
MKKCIEFYTILTITMFLVSCSIFSTTSSKQNEISIQNVKQKIDKIITYHVNLKTRIYPPEVLDMSPKDSNDFDTSKYTRVESNVFGLAGKKMSIETKTIPPDMDLETESKLIYDGTWLWVELKVKRFPKVKIDEPKISAMKIRISDVSPDPKNQPFNTIYGQTGTGIFKYTDFPGTLKILLKDYNFTDIKSSKNTDTIIFSGYKAKNEKRKNEEFDQMEGNKELKDFIDRSTQFCKLWISKNSGLIEGYSIGQSDERTSMHSEIEYISINEKLPDDIFVYEPPEGVVVHDATAAVLQEAEKNKEE